MPRQSTKAITWPTKPNSEPIKQSTNRIGAKGLKTALFAAMCKNIFALAGPQS